MTNNADHEDLLQNLHENADTHDSAHQMKSDDQHSIDEQSADHVDEEISIDKPRVLPTRRCRLCWTDVEPTVEIPSSNLPLFLQPRLRVTYIDNDPDLGELIKPCLCKGTRRYIHEGCLRQMRMASMRTRRNQWEQYFHRCDICHFKYRLERMWLGRFISSRVNQVLLTASVLFLLTFALGFAADPILNLYLQPYSDLPAKDFLVSDTVDIKLPKIQNSRWGLHFAKGLASMGVLSLANVFTAITGPWQWWTIRNSFLQGGGRSGTTGRDRISSFSWIVLMVGVVTAFSKIYSLTHHFAASYLLNMSDRVKNVYLEDDDEDIKAVQPDLLFDDAKTK